MKTQVLFLCYTIFYHKMLKEVSRNKFYDVHITCVLVGFFKVIYINYLIYVQKFANDRTRVKPRNTVNILQYFYFIKFV